MLRNVLCKHRVIIVKPEPVVTFCTFWNLILQQISLQRDKVIIIMQHDTDNLSIALFLLSVS